MTELRGKVRILLFNWRDIKNPDAGGAEIFTHENVKRWLEAGQSVTFFTSEFPGCLKEETIDGVKVVRCGGKYSVYLQAYRYFRKHGSEYDLIIDEINTLPFLTPLYVKNKKIIVLIHQLAREVWLYEMPMPISALGYLLEPFYLRLYKKIPTLTISESTKSDLEKLGFGEIYIVPKGVPFKALKVMSAKFQVPTLLYIGRLKRSKRVHEIIRAFYLVRRNIPEARLEIAGEGDTSYLRYLKSLIANHDLADHVSFHGAVDNDTKLDLMKKAHALLVASVREGWGLVVTEANACGTPAVAYNVPGLRDSIRDGETGILCETTPEAMAEKASEILLNEKLSLDLSNKALEWAKEFDWAISAKKTLEAIEKIFD